ncbi:hypothetical protein BMF94_0689 [Rhodotorula taiwanensis]|uniref:Uncharacterized protein n=1 Tax=Rhodotorula taiwanensis TaxID=741276 RepID=A0A2S5BI79_9BASI|nr:hypothetical protein BMF94_0689 [Rhodotorula taiwanensis]
MPYQPRRRRAPLLREALVRSASQQPQSADTSQRMTWGEYREKIAEITQAGLSRLAGLDNDPATGLATASSAQRSEQAEYIRNWGEDMRSERWQDSVAESNALRSNLDSLLRRVQTETALTKRRWPARTLFLKTSAPSARQGAPASSSMPPTGMTAITDPNLPSHLLSTFRVPDYLSQSYNPYEWWEPRPPLEAHHAALARIMPDWNLISPLHSHYHQHLSGTHGNTNPLMRITAPLDVEAYERNPDRSAWSWGPKRDDST